MSIKPTDDGQYMVDVRPGGKAGKRYRRKFLRKSEARAYELYVLGKAGKREEWHTAPADRRTLTALIAVWWEIHGVTLKNADAEKKRLLKMAVHLGDVPAISLSKKTLLQYRAARLESGIAASTLNRDLFHLSGMFTTLIKMDEYREPNPLRGLPPLKQTVPEVIFLMPNQISSLLSLLEGDEKRVALVCLSTGARWSEAANLDASRVRIGRIYFHATKNGKNRVVPISAELEAEIKTRTNGRLFDVNYHHFREKLKQAVPDLPPGQSTHVMRHTFASHFMMNGGNIITLRDILGHAKIDQTMIYAHLAPDFLQHAIMLNPLGGGVGIEHAGQEEAG